MNLNPSKAHQCQRPLFICTILEPFSELEYLHPTPYRNPFGFLTAIVLILQFRNEPFWECLFDRYCEQLRVYPCPSEACTLRDKAAKHKAMRSTHVEVPRM